MCKILFPFTKKLHYEMSILSHYNKFHHDEFYFTCDKYDENFF